MPWTPWDWYSWAQIAECRSWLACLNAPATHLVPTEVIKVRSKVIKRYPCPLEVVNVYQLWLRSSEEFVHHWPLMSIKLPEFKWSMIIRMLYQFIRSHPCWSEVVIIHQKWIIIMAMLSIKSVDDHQKLHVFQKWSMISRIYPNWSVDVHVHQKLFTVIRIQQKPQK